jgi:chromate transporter
MIDRPPAESAPAPARAPARGARRLGELGDLATTFLRLGVTAFGGPAAHIALMEREFVRRRRWLSAGDFLDLVGAASLIPGPSSTEVAIYVGYRRAGAAGLALAGLCFILPAALLVSGLAWAYVRYGQLPTAAGLLRGVAPVIVAIVVQALWGFGRAAVKTPLLAALGLAALALHLRGVPPLVLLALSGAACAATRARPGPLRALAGPLVPAAAAAVAGAALATTAPAGRLFLVFLKAGSVVFGSGYVLFAFLRADLVERLGWLSERQLVDAIAVGQVTPGPVFTSATFIGWLLGGPLGAFLATVGIFLPSFLLVAATAPLLPRLRRSRVAGGFLDGVNVASLALMAAVSFQLARTALVDVPTGAIALASLALLLASGVSSSWLVLAGGLVGIGLLSR